MRQVIFMFLMLAVPSAGFPATLHVPADYSFIQEAIDAAVNGDTVLVAPGTYVENIDFIGKAITVKSSDGAETTVIDGGNPSNPDYGSCAFFGSGEDSNSILEGFKLTNGIGSDPDSYGPLNGGGIYCKASSPTIMNNTITWNIGLDGGGGIYCEASSPTITNNTISENLVQGRGAGAGGGIFCTDSSSPTIMNNTISGNRAIGEYLFPGTNGIGGGICCTDSSSPTIMNNTISGNTVVWGNGGGIFCSDSSPTIMNNTISGNRAGLGQGGGIYCHGSSSTIMNNTITGNSAVGGAGGGIYAGLNSSVNVLNTILWDNSTSYGGNGPEIAIGPSYYPSTLSISYSDVKGGQSSVHVEPGSTLNWGKGMIDKDPLFTVGPNGFLYLSQIAAGQAADSPCLDSGSDLAGNLGMDIYWTRTDEVADAGTVDMGYHYGSFLIPPLQADLFWILENVGGTANFLLHAGAQNANRTYLLLGSISGTDPGTSLPGGTTTLPLNWDLLTTVILQNLNTSAFHDFTGILDINGSGAAQLNIGPVPGAAGIRLHFAYCLNNPFDFVSNPIAVEIVE